MTSTAWFLAIFGAVGWLGFAVALAGWRRSLHEWGIASARRSRRRQRRWGRR